MKKTTLTREQILSTGLWYLSEYGRGFDGFFFTKRSLSEDGWTFYLKMIGTDGYAEIVEENGGPRGENIQIFRGYLMNLQDLNDAVRLLDLMQGLNE